MDYDYIEQGDCLGLMKNIPDGSIDLIVTDPPYLVNYCRHIKGHKFEKPIKNDKNAEDLIKTYILECYRIQKDCSNIFCFASIKTYSFFEECLISAGYKIKNTIIWDKCNGGMGDTSTTYAPRYEILFYAEKGKTKIHGKRFDDIWTIKKVNSNEQFHQNQKPIELIERCILQHSNEGDVVFDGFLGSGTTAVAAVNTNRHYIGFELDEAYFNIACGKLDEVEGKCVE